MQPFLAYIMPVHGDGGEGIWGPTDPRPTPPIHLPGGGGGGGQPPGIWGGAPLPWPTPPIYIEIPPDVIDGKPEHPIYIPIYPAHPIVIPPDSLGPGVPSHPIYLPPPMGPSHPIFLPPGAIDPGPPLKPSHPIYLPVYPAHPIVLPPEGGDGVLPPPTEGKMWVVLAVPDVGYKVVQVQKPPGYNPPPGGARPDPHRGAQGQTQGRR